MRTSVFYAMAAANIASAHLTFQSIVIDGKDQGQHFAVQTPSNGNNPIKDVTSTAMICNGGTATADQVTVAAGSKITMQFHHNDGASTAGDADEPIAASHKGPIMVYLTQASTSGKGAVWTKIYEDGYSGGKWAVDTFITNKGALEITLPNVAAGDYWIRPEIIALHEASTIGAAQFYNGCGQIKVTGSGSLSLPTAGTDMTKAYSATEAGVHFDIYNSFTSYPIPGPAVWTGAGSATTPASSSKAATSAVAEATSSAAATKPASSAVAVPTTLVTATKPAATSAAATSAAATKPATSAAATSAKPAATGTSGSVALYAQCGGKNYTGATSCAAGTCKVQNDYYSQCIN